jgi:hypothetical protein
VPNWFGVAGGETGALPSEPGGTFVIEERGTPLVDCRLYGVSFWWISSGNITVCANKEQGSNARKSPLHNEIARQRPTKHVPRARANQEPPVRRISEYSLNLFFIRIPCSLKMNRLLNSHNKSQGIIGRAVFMRRTAPVISRIELRDINPVLMDSLL